MADFLNTDIYNLASLITDVEKKYTNDSEETLSVGMYGYMNEIFRRIIYNQIKLSSELSNEVFPTRARFDRNVLMHAISNNITDINATPAYMDVLLCIPESDFESFLTNNNTNQLIISRNCKLSIEDFEFHLDYDIKLTRSNILNNKVIYTATYDMSKPNQLSNEDNPYLPSPFIMRYNNQNFIYISTKIRQVQIESTTSKIITDNNLYNKTLEVTFENQLSCIDIYATDDEVTTHIIPVLEGKLLSDLDTENIYCYYTIIDTNRIRIKFEPSQYIPKLNTSLEIKVQTTRGEEGNFTYANNIFVTLEDDEYTYNGLQVMMIPKSNSQNGENKKSIDKIKKLIPKEALSRGVISTSKDLNNYLNNLNTDNIKVQIQEKINNQFKRVYYSYIVVRNNLGNIIPTNTVNTIIDETKFLDYINKDTDNKKVNLVIKQGSIVVMKNTESGLYSEILPYNTPLESLSDYDFIYSIPFMSVITYNGPFVSFYANVMQRSEDLIFSYINDSVPIQFIAINLLFSRSYNTEDGKYKLQIELTQNIDSDMGVIEFDKLPDGTKTIKENNLKVIAVLYNKPGVVYRYMIGELKSYKFGSTYKYYYEFEFLTNDILNEDNYIRIENTIQPETENIVYGYLNPNPDIDIFILNKFKNENGEVVEYGRDKLDVYIPNLEGYSLTNKYTSKNGISFFTNYSDIMSSIVEPLSISSGSSVDGFKLSGLPVIKYDYCLDEEKIQSFMSILKNTKDYLDEAIELLENQFGIDFKFFNTYGPSTTYYLDSTYDKVIDRVNISVIFEVKLKKVSDDNTKNKIATEIKGIIENIDNIGSIHIPNIITQITNNYSTLIEYIEFKSIDSYGPGYQHIYRKNPDETYTVPELLSINMLDSGIPDISIRVV